MERVSEWVCAYGLLFQDQTAGLLRLPFMAVDPEPNDVPDVVIRIGDAPEVLDGAVLRHRLWNARPGEFLLNDEHVGRFWAHKGREVIIAPSPNADWRELRMFVTGSVSAAILQQRGLLPLHASGVNIGGQAVLFAGPSGSGKSTLMAQWLCQEYAAISDEIIALAPGDGGQVTAFPAYPAMKLWSDAISYLELGSRVSDTTYVGRNIPKHILPMARFDPAPIPVRAVFRLARGVSQKPQARRLSGTEAFEGLFQVCYRTRILHGLGMQELQFRTVAALARGAEVFEITRGADTFTAPAMTEAILEALQPIVHPA